MAMASLFNLAGPDLIIIALILAMLAVPVLIGAVILWIVMAVRRQPPKAPSIPPPPPRPPAVEPPPVPNIP